MDTSELREALLAEPWIARAAVHRKMPDTLVVSLVEHVPAAYWNNDGLYDAQNQEIFKPDLRSFSEPLVRLGAYRDNLAPEVYESAVTFIRILEPSRYHMVALYLDQVRCYTIIGRYQAYPGPRKGKKRTTSRTLVKIVAVDGY